MRTTAISVLTALSIAALGGCPADGSGAAVTESNAATRYSTEFCAFVFSCECSDYGYPDEEFCRTSVHNEIDVLISEGQRANLTFDSECFDEELTSDALGECIPPTSGSDDVDQDCSYCDLYYGTVAKGDECQEFGYFNDCAKGLYCEDGRCVDPCGQVAEGEVCLRPSGAFEDCAEGLSCDFDSQVCVRLAAIGEACSPVGCVDGSYCGLESICEPIPQRGETCSFECESPLVCGPTSVCDDPPSDGQPCPTGQCADGHYCDTVTDEVDWTCRSYADDGEPCTDDFDCKSERCADETCAAQEAWVCE